MILTAAVPEDTFFGRCFPFTPAKSQAGRVKFWSYCLGLASEEQPRAVFICGGERLFRDEREDDVLAEPLPGRRRNSKSVEHRVPL
jgi:hypothetical protein